MSTRTPHSGNDLRTYAQGLPQRGDLARRSILLLVVAAAAAFAVLAQLGENGIVAWWRLRGETARLEAQVARTEAANEAMRQRLTDLAANPEALEFLARERYGMRRPDEEVLTVLQPSTDKDDTANRLP